MLLSRTVAWRQIQELETFGFRDLSNVSYGFLLQYIGGLEKAGYVKKIAESRGNKSARYQLVRSTGAEAPVVDRYGQVKDPNLGKAADNFSCCWRAIRILKNFSIPELSSCTEVSYKLTEEYVSSLCRTGFLGKCRGHRFRLINNSGPLAPILRRSRKEIIDPNTNKIYSLGVKNERVS